MLLGKKYSTRPKTYDFAFRGPIRCGECGALITAEHKVKRQKNGVVRQYVYYHCTKKKDKNCSQKSMEEKVLGRQIEKVLASIEIPKEFHKWAMDVLREQNEVESQDRTRILENQRQEYDSIVRKIDNLIDLRANGEITEDEFSRRKVSLTSGKDRIELLITDTKSRVDEWLKIAENYFDFAEQARESFGKATLEGKKNILSSLGSNLTIKDRELSVLLPEPLELIKEASPTIREIHSRFEPQESIDKYKDLARRYSESPILLRGWDSNPQPLR